MNAQNLELVPAIVLWRMAAQFPDDYALQQAVKQRDRDYRDARYQNSRDMAAAAERRAWELEYRRNQL